MTITQTITVTDSTGNEDASWATGIGDGDLSVVLVPEPGQHITLKQIGQTMTSLAELLDAMTEEMGERVVWLLGGMGFDDDGTVRIKARGVTP